MFDTEQTTESEGGDTEDLKLVLGDEVAKGIYANLVSITHSKEEFVIDFIRVMPEPEEESVVKGSVVSRLIITPGHAERFLDTLAQHVMQFEEDHGRLSKAGAGIEEEAHASSEEALPSIFPYPEAEA